MTLTRSLLRNPATRLARRILTNNPVSKKISDLRLLRLEAELVQRRVAFVENILPKDGIGAELGVYKGQFSPVLLKHARTAKLHLVDPWYMATSHWHWGPGTRSTIDALVNILQSLKPEIENGSVVVHVGDDRQVLATFPDHYFDWVYIDSVHSYAHTKDELEILQHKVKEQGIIAGDDWRPDPTHFHHGVCQAVQEFVALGEYEIIHSDESTIQWAIRRRSASGSGRTS